jgi:hypothetical protein
MAEVDGKTVMKAPDGRLYRVPAEQVEQVSRDLSWAPASDDEAAKRQAEREQFAKHGGAGEQALAAGEQVLRTASLGVLPGMGDDAEIAGREAVLREQHPVVSFGAQALGAALPALAGGALAEGALGAAGLVGGEAAGAGALGARGAGLVSAGVEGLAGGTADEIEQARAESRDVSAGNIFLYGLGGEIVGRALPKALAMGAGRVKRALSAVEEAAGEGIGDALASTEARSLSKEADLARELPKGSPERAAALDRTSRQQFDRIANDTATDLDAVVETAANMGEGGKAKHVDAALRDAVSETSPAQVERVTELKQRLAEVKKAQRSPLAEDIPEPRAPEGGAVPEGEPLPPRKPRTAADGPMKGYAERIDAVVDRGLGRLDKTTSPGEQFIALREVRRGLAQVQDELARKGERGAALRGLVESTWQDVHAGLGDESIFGRAAVMDRELSSPWRDKIGRGLGTAQDDLARHVSVDGSGATRAQFDPKKTRSFFEQDITGRKLTQDKLSDVLDGAEDLAAAHERHGTWSPEQIAAQRERIGRVRQALELADDVHAAKANRVASAAERAAKPSLGDKIAGEVQDRVFDRAGGMAAAAVGGLVGGPVGATVGFLAGEGIKVAKRLVGMDAAARAATKQTARNLAGVGLGYAARAAGKAGEYGAAPVMTALSRFTGDYAGPEESFAAKRKLLDDEQVSPEVLYETLGQSLGDLPRVNPELFQTIAARTAQKIRYVRENLPPGLECSLLYPDGIPPSRSSLRDFATLWNTVFEPESVLDDINAGTASPQQMEALAASDPDLYGQLRQDVIEQVGAHFADVPTSTKQELDILFKGDGMAGPMFSSAAADMIGEAGRASKEAKPNGNQPSPSSGAAHAAAPSGLAAIRTSVTNRGSA